ncbi:glycoside hydrolase family 127 protein [soil metagenome]
MPAKLTPAALPAVRFDGHFWGDRIDVNRDVTLRVQFEQCRKSGRVDGFKLDWKPGQPNPPHQFWDSDVAKWIEAAAYRLATSPDAEIERTLDDAIDLIAAAQQPDGYLNTHYTVVEPQKRWTDLRDGHEMYCAGHMMEAAVAYYRATGKRKLLDVMSRMADHIATQFGTDPGKRRGYCGHTEIELALVKLADATGDEKYLRLAKYFIDERGQSPKYFDEERVASGQPPLTSRLGHDQFDRYDYYQADRPFREQKDLNGHSVRALYLLAGAIDVAIATNDAALLRVCKRMWRSAIERRMYVIGGAGSRRHGEAFTIDYDLPNETAYAETCANISLGLVAHRLLQIDPSNEHGDVMERAFCNGMAVGVSLSGDRFRYANPLTVHAEAQSPATSPHLAAMRQEWFGCCCCPTNVARVIASLGQYAFSTSPDAVFVHLFANGQGTFEIANTSVTVTQATEYPWKEKVSLTIDPESPATFAVALRLPAWCPKPSLKLNGKAVKLAAITKKGYAHVRRRWCKGDRIELVLPMPIERVRTNAAVRNNAGKVALQRGPIVYCLEEVDNGQQLHNLSLPARAKLTAKWEPRLLGGVVTIAGVGPREVAATRKLYHADEIRTKPVKLRAVPYCTWGNRRVGEMIVWIREK